MRAGFHRIARCRRGAAAVEFAIISSVLITLLVATVDFGRTLYLKNQLAYLADQAVRTVLLTPAVSDTVIESALRTGFTAGDADDLSVSITSEATGATVYRVLTINYPVTLFVPGVSSDALNLSVTRRVPTG